MSIWRKLLDFYINSSIHLSLAIICLALVTCLQVEIAVHLPLFVFIFLASVTGYNFIKYAGIARLHHFSLTPNIRVIQLFSLLVFIGLIISATGQPPEILILAGVLGFLTLLYALPVFHRRRNLRALPGIKIYITAFVVAGATVLMPLVRDMDLFQWDVLVAFIQRFGIVIALVLPFEIRDLKYDMAQLGTIPQILGVPRTRLVGYMLTAGFVLLEFLKQETNLASVLGIFVLAGITGVALKRSGVNQPKYFTSFWVEAVPVFWLMALWALKELL